MILAYEGEQDDSDTATLHLRAGQANTSSVFHIASSSACSFILAELLDVGII